MDLSLEQKQGWLEKAIGYFALICIAVTAALATGCTNNFGSSGLNNSHVVSTANWNTPTIPAFASSPYNCPFTANVIPNYDYNDNGTDDFTVCPSNTSATDILVKGKTETSADICVFPLSYADAEDIQPILNASNGMPTYQCQTLNATGTDFSFPDLSFNYVYIVESQDLGAMVECQMSQNFITCPTFSAGQFR